MKIVVVRVRVEERSIIVARTLGDDPEDAGGLALVDHLCVEHGPARRQLHERVAAFRVGDDLVKCAATSSRLLANLRKEAITVTFHAKVRAPDDHARPKRTANHLES